MDFVGNGRSTLALLRPFSDGPHPQMAARLSLCVPAFPHQAELLIAVHIEGVPKQEYAARLGITPSAVSHRLKTAEKNFRKIFPTSSSFDPSRG